MRITYFDMMSIGCASRLTKGERARSMEPSIATTGGLPTMLPSLISTFARLALPSLGGMSAARLLKTLIRHVPVQVFSVKLRPPGVVDVVPNVDRDHAFAGVEVTVTRTGMPSSATPGTGSCRVSYLYVP
jgi:hypothetical protein